AGAVFPCVERARLRKLPLPGNKRIVRRHRLGAAYAVALRIFYNIFIFVRKCRLVVKIDKERAVFARRKQHKAPAVYGLIYFRKRTIVPEFDYIALRKSFGGRERQRTGGG